MNKRRKIEDLLPGDPRIPNGIEQFRQYRDHVGNLTPAERKEYRGKVLAVLSETGEIIAAASDVESLRITVAESKYNGCDWRLTDGPTGDDPISRSELDY
tara:strand:- start:548 stop:847 length:300 start_codon:yes stop_codon:yes gene_type:complete